MEHEHKIAKFVNESGNHDIKTLTPAEKIVYDFLDDKTNRAWLGEVWFWGVDETIRTKVIDTWLEIAETALMELNGVFEKEIVLPNKDKTIADLVADLK